MLKRIWCSKNFGSEVTTKEKIVWNLRLLRDDKEAIKDYRIQVS